MTGLRGNGRWPVPSPAPAPTAAGSAGLPGQAPQVRRLMMMPLASFPFFFFLLPLP